MVRERLTQGRLWFQCAIVESLNRLHRHSEACNLAINIRVQFEKFGIRSGEASVVSYLGNAFRGLGMYEEAEKTLLTSILLFDEIFSARKIIPHIE